MIEAYSAENVRKVCLLSLQAVIKFAVNLGVVLTLNLLVCD